MKPRWWFLDFIIALALEIATPIFHKRKALDVYYQSSAFRELWAMVLYSKSLKEVSPAML